MTSFLVMGFNLLVMSLILLVIKKLRPNHSSLADILNLIGLVYKNQGKYEEALKYLNESLKVKKQAFPSNDSSIGHSFYNIGVVYYNQGKYEEALKYYNQTLEIYKQTLPLNDSSIEDSISISDSLLKDIIFDIGLTHFYQGEFEEALKY